MAKIRSFKFNIIKFSLSALIISSSWQSQAGTKDDIASIQSKLDSRKPPVKVKSIKTTPINGIYEIFNGISVIYSDKSFSHVILGGSIIETTNKDEVSFVDKLTKTEKEIYGYLILGYKPKQIEKVSNKLYNTVRKHIQNIYTKAEIHNYKGFKN